MSKLAEQDFEKHVAYDCAGTLGICVLIGCDINTGKDWSLTQRLSKRDAVLHTNGLFVKDGIVDALLGC